MSGTQVVEQALLVRLCQRIVLRRLGDASRLQLLEQCRSRAIQFGGELGDGGRCHGFAFLAWGCVRGVRAASEQVVLSGDRGVRW